MATCLECDAPLPRESRYCLNCGRKLLDEFEDDFESSPNFVTGGIPLKKQELNLAHGAFNNLASLCGHEVWSKLVLGQKIKLYQKGYISLPSSFGPQTPPEKLISIKVDFSSTMKNPVARGAAAFMTGGYSLLLAKNNKGNLFVAITTDIKTHMLRTSGPTPRQIEPCLELEGWVNQLIAKNN